MTYWVVAAALTVFGFITGFSIGQPFLLLGLVLRDCRANGRVNRAVARPDQLVGPGT